MPALARLRRAWLEERAGHPVDAPGFEAAFAEWWRVELPRRTFWLAEVGSERSGFTAIGSINVVEIVHMPRPGARPGRIGHIGNAFVLASFADRGCPRPSSRRWSSTPASAVTAACCSPPPRAAPRSTGARGSTRRASRCWRWIRPPDPAVVGLSRGQRWTRLPSRSRAECARRALPGAGPGHLVGAGCAVRAAAVGGCGRPHPGRGRRAAYDSGHGSRTAGGGRQPRSADRRARPAPVRQARAAALPLPPRRRPRASSGPSAGPGCRCRTRTASARTRGCPGSAPRPPGRPARPSTSRSGSPRRSSPAVVARALDAALRRTASTCSPRRPQAARRWPTGSTRAGGPSSCPASRPKCSERRSPPW